MKNYNTFVFLDEDEEPFARVQLDLADRDLLTKCSTLNEFFQNFSDSSMTIEEMEELVEDKFCEFFGYDCKAELFGHIQGLQKMEDGKCFAFHVLDAIGYFVVQEALRRNAERAKRILKYTEKYTKGAL